MRLELTDFHDAPDGDRAHEISIRLVFLDLTPGDRSAFAEYLTYRESTSSEAILVLTWVARRAENDGPVRRFMPIEWRTGDKADGPLLDAGARFLFQATYLRPLRDAERAMSAGRGRASRKSFNTPRSSRSTGSSSTQKPILRPIRRPSASSVSATTQATWSRTRTGSRAPAKS